MLWKWRGCLAPIKNPATNRPDRRLDTILCSTSSSFLWVKLPFFGRHLDECQIVHTATFTSPLSLEAIYQLLQGSALQKLAAALLQPVLPVCYLCVVSIFSEETLWPKLCNKNHCVHIQVISNIRNRVSVPWKFANFVVVWLFIMNLYQLDKQSTKFTIWKYWKGCVKKLDGNDPKFCQQLMDLASRQCTCPQGTVCEGVFSY